MNCPHICKGRQSWPFNGHIKTADSEQRINLQQYGDGTLAVDGWAVTFGTANSEEGPGRAAALLVVPNVTAHPLTARVPTSYYSMRHYNWQYPLKG